MLKVNETRTLLFLFKRNEGRVQFKAYGTYMGYKNQNLNQRPNNLVCPHAWL